MQDDKVTSHSPSRKAEARKAEEWVAIAKTFGEECLKIFKDEKLTIAQKLEKQESLSNKIKKEIEQDASLGKEDKHQMQQAVTSYLEEWKILYSSTQAL